MLRTIAEGATATLRQIAENHAGEIARVLQVDGTHTAMPIQSLMALISLQDIEPKLASLKHPVQAVAPAVSVKKKFTPTIVT